MKNENAITDLLTKVSELVDEKHRERNIELSGPHLDYEEDLETGRFLNALTALGTIKQYLLA